MFEHKIAMIVMCLLSVWNLTVGIVDKKLFEMWMSGAFAILSIMNLAFHLGWIRN